MQTRGINDPSHGAKVRKMYQALMEESDNFDGFDVSAGLVNNIYMYMYMC